MKSSTFYLTMTISLLIGACAIKKDTAMTTKAKSISKIIYDYYYEFPKDAAISLDEYQDTLISNFESKYGLSLSEEETKAIRILDKLKDVKPSEIHLEFKEDTVWRYKTDDGLVKTELARVDLEEGVYHIFSDADTIQINFFEGDSTYTVHQISKKEETILGYNCNQILINGCAESIEKYPYSIGNSIFELWVTNEIDLPMHSIVPINKKYQKKIPLKARIWDSECDGIIRIYEAKEIIYKQI